MIKINLTIFLSVLCATSLTYAQVGVNTNSPETTFDVVAGGGAAVADGLTAPRLTRTQLTAKNAATYGTAETGAIVYVTSIDGTTNTETANITAVGYYYFNGSAWVPFGGGSNLDETVDVWVDDSTNNRVELGTQSDGSTARTTGTQFVALDNGNVGIGTDSPDSSAILDLTSSSKGLLIPRVALQGTNDDNAASPTVPSPAVGLLVFNTTADDGTAIVGDEVSANTFYYFNGTDWELIVDGTELSEALNGFGVPRVGTAIYSTATQNLSTAATGTTSAGNTFIPYEYPTSGTREFFGNGVMERVSGSTTEFRVLRTGFYAFEGFSTMSVSGSPQLGLTVGLIFYATVIQRRLSNGNFVTAIPASDIVAGDRCQLLRRATAETCIFRGGVVLNAGEIIRHAVSVIRITDFTATSFQSPVAGSNGVPVSHGFSATFYPVN